ncbi:hypothetical protein MPL1032_230290 [Mesorhizobium plurifarium]|uniref:Uncharacterized protein n=1 Tax=Mesorhizobium plurifarium TaxID=69974 RepID=A0A0K2W017_MESPL|nr:hypothetical protein MPL1032_230290 [Mesorhizobium plurifarium]
MTSHFQTETGAMPDGTDAEAGFEVLEEEMAGDRADAKSGHADIRLAPAPKTKRPAKGRSFESLNRGSFSAFLRLQNLAAAIHAGLQVDVVRAAHFAGILVLDIGRGLEGVGRAAHAALRRRGFSFWNGHGYAPLHGQNAPATLAKGPHRGHNLRKSGAYTRLAPFWPALAANFFAAAGKS